MDLIKIAELKAQGYTEDREGRRRFMIPYAAINWACIIVFIASLLLTFLCFSIQRGLGMIGDIVMVALLPCIPIIMLTCAAMYYSRPKSRHTSKRLLKYKRADSAPGTSTELVYVCPDSWTYFSYVFVGGNCSAAGPWATPDISTARPFGETPDVNMPPGFAMHPKSFNIAICTGSGWWL